MKSLIATWMWGLLAGLVLTNCCPANAADAPAADAAVKPALQELDEVVVYATSGEVVAGLHAESELNEQDIAAYGANTVGDLLTQVAPDVDNTEQGPVILVNGKPANGIRSVNDLPPESIARIEVLPPQTAAAIGESPTRRVINVVLKSHFRQGTANLSVRGATAGGGTSGNGNYSMVKLVNGNIRNVNAYVNQRSSLLEADRGIQSQSAVVPYDLTGNVLSWPVPGGEIDPALSAAAGEPVTVAAVPVATTMPGLQDFVASANSANLSDMGRYRTLVPRQLSYGLNGNLGRQLPHRISLNLNANLDRSHSRALTGATSALLQVPGGSAFSPFDNDVGVARYLGAPLRQLSDTTNANLAANLSMQLGKWRLMSDTTLSWNRSSTDSARRVDTGGLQAAIDAGTVDPFGPLPPDLLATMLSDHARGHGHDLSARLQLAGAPFSLPAGKANLNLTAQWEQTAQHARTVGTNNVGNDLSRRDELANLNLQLPLLGTPQSQGFGMAGEISGAAHRQTATGTLVTYGVGLNGREGNRVNLRVAYNLEKQAPTPSSLNDPIVVVDGYRAYDFLRQETVLVRYITGGNPDLRVENRDVVSLSGQARPLKNVDFTLNAQYSHTIYHDPIQSLPPPSAEVEAAFPDRFLRDADGHLYQIDARMVNFARTRNEQLRWGGNLRRSFGGGNSAAPGGMVMVSGPGGGPVYIGDGSDSLSGAGWRLNFNFIDQWQMAYKRILRRGLPVVDLLAGGAGFGTPQPRHRVNSTFGLARNGTGMQLNASWSSPSHLDTGTAAAPSRLDFSSTLQFDLQAFTDLGNLNPGNKPLKGVRISLQVSNVLDFQQRVTDQNGMTPLRFQPYLVNPLGRTVSLSFRKAFS